MFEFKSILIQSSKSHSLLHSFSLVVTLNYKQISENFIHRELHGVQGKWGCGRGRLYVWQDSEPCWLRKLAAERKLRTQRKWETTLAQNTNGWNYVSLLEIQECVGRVVKARLREDRGSAWWAPAQVPRVACGNSAWARHKRTAQHPGRKQTPQGSRRQKAPKVFHRVREHRGEHERGTPMQREHWTEVTALP